jgi:cytidylate kinase
VPEQFVHPELVEQLALLAGGVARPVVLIDGGSGSGKSTLAGPLATALGAELVHLEDLYPGWDGLQAASDQLFTEVLTSAAPRWQGWDWEKDAVTHWRTVNAVLPLVVEGSGALSRRNRGAATLGVWVELDEEARKRRAIDRDGDRYAPHWDRWAKQEREFALREHPSELADVIVRADTGEIRVRSA